MSDNTSDTEQYQPPETAEPGDMNRRVPSDVSTDVAYVYQGNQINRTWSLTAIRDFTKSYNPQYIRSRIENAKTNARKDAEKGDYVKWIILLGIFLVCAAIAWNILGQGGGGGSASSAGKAVGSAAGTSISLMAARIRGD